MRHLLLAVAAALVAHAANAQTASDVHLTRLPDGALQPQVATDPGGTLHLVYFKGEARAGDLFYSTRVKDQSALSEPIRVNSEPNCAVATGTIRGAQIALGKDSRLHVVWNGTPTRNAEGRIDHAGAPVLYTRFEPATSAFAPQRNLMTRTSLLDGGCTLAADSFGRVTVAWHGVPKGIAQPTEDSRQVFFTFSDDEGKTFPAEAPATPDHGVCPCCGMGGFADACGRVYLVYRGAHETTQRGMVLLRADCADRKQTPVFTSVPLQEWRLQACPMSSAGVGAQPSSLGPTNPRLAWETAGQVWLATSSSTDASLSTPVCPPGEAGGRKHPRVAVNRKGQTLLVWTNVAGWGKEGSLAWQLFDENNKPIDAARGSSPGVPAWSFAAPIALQDGSFEILY